MSELFFTPELVATATKMLEKTPLEDVGLVGEGNTGTGLAKKPETVFESFGQKKGDYPEDKNGRPVIGAEEAEKAEAWLKEKGSHAGGMEIL